MTTKQEKPPTISELKELAKLPEAEASEGRSPQNHRIHQASQRNQYG
jgi:hypothetical protein